MWLLPLLLGFVTEITSLESRSDVFPFGIPNVSLLNISSSCSSNLVTWTEALLLVSKVSEECFTKQVNCTNEETAIIKENLWALRQLNAFGFFNPLGIVGEQRVYDGSLIECEAVSGIKYDTNYCYMMYAAFADSCSLKVKVATCMPRSCSNEDLMTIFSSIRQYPNKLCESYCAFRDVPKDSAFWIYTTFMIIMLVTVVIASLVEYYRQDMNPRTELKILYAFSIYSNSGQLLSVKEQREGFIKSLDCIRLFSMSWVAFGHSTMFFLVTDEESNMIKVANPVINQVMFNAVLSVDTFFLLSGIVLAYMFFEERPKPSVIKSPSTWVLFYAHRYLRLTPPMMIFIGFYTVYSPYIQGVFDTSFLGISTSEYCRTGWWQNLLYINNFYDTQCYCILWYLAVNTQIYVVMPIFLLALYYSYMIGVLFILSGCVASITATYVLTYEYNLPANGLGFDPSGKFQSMLYERPWIRCTPYLIGILVGYIIAVYGKRRFRLNWIVSILIWSLATAVALACVFGDHQYFKKSFSFNPGEVWPKFVRATYYSFFRIGWALVVSWVILACHFGWAGPIGNFMTHPIWQPFGRLSYCAYIVHWMVIGFYMNLSDKPLHFYRLSQVYFQYAIPITIMAYAFAFIWSCMFEIPALKLEKLAISKLMKASSKTFPEKKER